MRSNIFIHVRLERRDSRDGCIGDSNKGGKVIFIIHGDDSSIVVDSISMYLMGILVWI